MATRKDLGKELMRQMNDLLNKITRSHSGDSGSTYVSSDRVAWIHQMKGGSTRNSQEL